MVGLDWLYPHHRHQQHGRQHGRQRNPRDQQDTDRSKQEEQRREHPQQAAMPRDRRAHDLAPLVEVSDPGDRDAGTARPRQLY